MRRARNVRAAVFAVEVLEARQLLAWGAFPTLIDQDLAASTYPQYKGAGQVIANLDSGINFRHPALAGRIWTNPREIPDNGIDDDQSGKIDDVYGWDFVSNDNDPKDDQGHGTMTAGIIAANHFVNTGNSRGYAGDGREYEGIASDARVVPLKVVNASGGVSISHVEAALKWVITNHTRYNITVVNMSLDVGSDGYYTIRDEVQTLWESGVFISGSSGNGGNLSNWISWPAASPYAAAVGAVNSDGAITWVTTRGPSLDLLAPGHGVPYLSQGTDYYLGGAGTSYSAPFVAGAAAVINQVNPSFTPNQILQILRDSGTDTYDSATKLTFKRLNLQQAIALALARKSNSVASPSPTPTQSPFSGTPIPVPGYVQAENFDHGGYGISYYDSSAKNLGGAYRATSVDLWPAKDAGDGFRVGDVWPGEWLEYTITVAQTGIYNVSTRVASPVGGGTFHMELDGVNKTGTLTVPSTGSWNSWRTVTKTGVTLEAGRHILRLRTDSAVNGNPTADFNWVNITYVSPVPPPTALQSATDTIQAESCSSQSGMVVGSTGLSYVDSGDWAQYKGVDFGDGVNAFIVRVAVADAYAGKQIVLRVDGPTGPVIGSLTVKGTGGWGIFQDQSVSVTGTKGIHDLYLTFSGGSGVGNIDSFRFRPVPSSETLPVRSAKTQIEAETYSAQNGVIGDESNLSYIDAGDWVQYADIDFGDGVSAFTVRVAVADAYAGRRILLRTGSVDGLIIGSLDLPGTGGWGIFEEVTSGILGTIGVQSLYLTFEGGSGVGNIDWFLFS